MLEINKTHEITSKIQVFGPQILWMTIHGKGMPGSKNKV